MTFLWYFLPQPTEFDTRQNGQVWKIIILLFSNLHCKVKLCVIYIRHHHHNDRHQKWSWTHFSAQSFAYLKTLLEHCKLLLPLFEWKFCQLSSTLDFFSKVIAYFSIAKNENCDIFRDISRTYFWQQHFFSSLFGHIYIWICSVFAYRHQTLLVN